MKIPRAGKRQVVLCGVFGLGHRWAMTGQPFRYAPAKIARLLDQAYQDGYGSALFRACREMERFAAQERKNER